MFFSTNIHFYLSGCSNVQSLKMFLKYAEKDVKAVSALYAEVVLALMTIVLGE